MFEWNVPMFWTKNKYCKKDIHIGYYKTMIVCDGDQLQHENSVRSFEMNQSWINQSIIYNNNNNNE